MKTIALSIQVPPTAERAVLEPLVRTLRAMRSAQEPDIASAAAHYEAQFSARIKELDTARPARKKTKTAA